MSNSHGKNIKERIKYWGEWGVVKIHMLDTHYNTKEPLGEMLFRNK